MGASLYGSAGGTPVVVPQRGWVNVMTQPLFPVYGNGVNDDTAAVQAIIFANPGRVIYFPSGTYKKSGPWVNFNDNCILQGDGRGATFIEDVSGDATDPLQFYCLLKDTVTRFVNGCGIRDLTIFTGAAKTLGFVRLTQCNQFEVFSVNFNNIPRGILIEGGQLSRWAMCAINVSGSQFNLAGDPTSAMITLKEVALDGGLFQRCFTQKFVNLDFAGSRAVYACWNVQMVDGLELSNCYMGGGFTTLWNFNSQSNVAGVSYISGVSINNTYHDGLSNVNGSQYLVLIPPDANANFQIYDITITGGNLNNGSIGCITIRRPVTSLKLNGVQCANLPAWLVDTEGDAASSMLSVQNCTVNGFEVLAGPGGLIRCKNHNVLEYTGNTVRTNLGSGAVLSLEGTINYYNLDGNVHVGCPIDFVHGATPVNLVKNRGFNVTSDVTANSINSNFYEGTFTPAVNFGNAHVGLTYSVQIGIFSRIGNTINFTADALLSAKGSSVGTMTLTGLPSIANASIDFPVSVSITSMTAGVGTNHCIGRVLAGGTGMIIAQMNGAGAEVNLVDTDFTNVSRVRVNGSYHL